MKGGSGEFWPPYSLSEQVFDFASHRTEYPVVRF
ncbi:hypothetical protein DP59_5968 [Burkholderia pseudomallei]|nr:hypothetical protein DP59_5968 [Burkholderia pseudomallei]